MKTTGQRWTIRQNNNHQLNAMVEWVKLQWVAGHDVTLQVLKADRSSRQNAMFYGLYGDIARAMGDRTVVEVKRDCKLRYGVAIRKAADPAWAEFYDRAIKPMSMEDKLVLMDDLPITSEFTKEQATDYINSIIIDYTRQGIILENPAA